MRGPKTRNQITRQEYLPRKPPHDSSSRPRPRKTLQFSPKQFRGFAAYLLASTASISAVKCFIHVYTFCRCLTATSFCHNVLQIPADFCSQYGFRGFQLSPGPFSASLRRCVKYCLAVLPSQCHKPQAPDLLLPQGPVSARKGMFISLHSRYHPIKPQSRRKELPP